MTVETALRCALVLPIAALIGMACAALAAAYTQLIEAGAAVDGATFRHAFMATRHWCRRHVVPRALVLISATVMALVALPMGLAPTWLGAAHVGVCAVLLTLAIIDARVGLLPDALTLPLLWSGLLMSWAGHGPALHDAVVAAALAYGLLRAMNAAFLCWRGTDGMGGGDMKLLAALGAWLGWAPLPTLLLVACVAAVLYVAVQAGRRSWRASLAFGPFLSMAGGLWIVGHPVVQFLF